jgi:hypothetical protein
MRQIKVTVLSTVEIVEPIRVGPKQVTAYMPGRQRLIGGDEDASTAEASGSSPFDVIRMPEHADQKSCGSISEEF